VKTNGHVRLRTWLDDVAKQDQNWLAAALDISPAHLSMILSGTRQPSVTLASKIWQLTGIAAAEFREDLAAIGGLR
jgi:DNA-binding transcriptional regulator YdaS (Cro superfamily)